jgi:hypothetical protein
MAKTVDENNPNISREDGVTYFTVPTLVVGNEGQEIKGTAELAFNFDLKSNGVDSALADYRNTEDAKSAAERRQTRAQERSGNGVIETALMGRVDADPSHLGAGRLTAMRTAEQHGAQTYSELSTPPSHFDTASAEARARIEGILADTLNPTNSNAAVQKLQAIDNALLLESQNNRNYPLDVGTSNKLTINNGSATLLPEKNGHPILGVGLSAMGQGKYVDENRNELLITSVDTMRHELFHAIDPQFNKSGTGAQSTVEDRAVHHVNTFLAAEGKAPRASYLVPLEGMGQAKDIPIDAHHEGVLADKLPGGPGPRMGNVRSFPEYESQNAQPALIQGQDVPSLSAAQSAINKHVDTLDISENNRARLHQLVAENTQSAIAQQQESSLERA